MLSRFTHQLGNSLLKRPTTYIARNATYQWSSRLQMPHPPSFSSLGSLRCISSSPTQLPRHKFPSWYSPVSGAQIAINRRPTPLTTIYSRNITTCHHKALGRSPYRHHTYRDIPAMSSTRTFFLVNWARRIVDPLSKKPFLLFPLILTAGFLLLASISNPSTSGNTIPTGYYLGEIFQGNFALPNTTNEKYVRGHSFAKRTAKLNNSKALKHQDYTILDLSKDPQAHLKQFLQDYYSNTVTIPLLYLYYRSAVNMDMKDYATTLFRQSFAFLPNDIKQLFLNTRLVQQLDLGTKVADMAPELQAVLNANRDGLLDLASLVTPNQYASKLVIELSQLMGLRHHVLNMYLSVLRAAGTTSPGFCQDMVSDFNLLRVDAANIKGSVVTRDVGLFEMVLANSPLYRFRDQLSKYWISPDVQRARDQGMLYPLATRFLTSILFNEASVEAVPVPVAQPESESVDAEHTNDNSDSTQTQDLTDSSYTAFKSCNELLEIPPDAAQYYSFDANIPASKELAQTLFLIDRVLLQGVDELHRVMPDHAPVWDRVEFYQLPSLESQPSSELQSPPQPQAESQPSGFLNIDDVIEEDDDIKAVGAIA